MDQGGPRQRIDLGQYLFLTHQLRQLRDIPIRRARAYRDLTVNGET
jgi:hypothetical protein